MKVWIKIFAFLKILFYYFFLPKGDELTQLRLDNIKTEDVESVLMSTKPSARQFKNKYEAWRKEYESV